MKSCQVPHWFVKMWLTCQSGTACWCYLVHRTCANVSLVSRLSNILLVRLQYHKMDKKWGSGIIESSPKKPFHLSCKFLWCSVTALEKPDLESPRRIGLYHLQFNMTVVFHTVSKHTFGLYSLRCYTNITKVQYTSTIRASWTTYAYIGDVPAGLTFSICNLYHVQYGQIENWGRGQNTKWHIYAHTIHMYYIATQNSMRDWNVLILQSLQ